MKRKVTAVLLTLLIVLSIGSVNVMASSNYDESYPMTFEEYVLFLSQMAEVEAFGINIFSENNLITANDILVAVNALSEYERIEFMRQLHDPTSWEISVSSEQVSIRPYGTTMDEGTIQPRNWPIGTHLVVDRYSDRDMTVLGIPLVRIRQHLVYTFFWGQRIDRVVRYNPHVVHNFSPMSQFGRPTGTATPTTNRVFASFTMSYSIGPLYGVSIQTGTLNGSMDGDVFGTFWVNWWWT